MWKSSESVLPVCVATSRISTNTSPPSSYTLILAGLTPSDRKSLWGWIAKLRREPRDMNGANGIYSELFRDLASACGRQV